MPAPIVSVILPVYNAEKYLSECLDSLINQSFKSFEVLAVNDGSTDFSLAILERYAGKDNRIIVFNQINQGVSSARNRALQAVRGRYIAFVDSDDFVAPDFLETLVKDAERLQTDLVVSNFYYYFEERDRMCSASTADSGFLSKEALLDLVFSINNSEKKGAQGGYLWNKLFRASVIDGVCFHPEIRMAEDEAFCLEVFEKLDGLYYQEKPLYFYRQHDQSLVHDSNSYFELLNTRLSFLKKEKYPRIVAAYVQCVIAFVGSIFLDGKVNADVIQQIKPHAQRANQLLREEICAEKYLSNYFRRWQGLLSVCKLNSFCLLLLISVIKWVKPRAIWDVIKKRL